MNSDSNALKEDDTSTDGSKPEDLHIGKVQTGVDAGNAIITAITADTFSGNFGKICKIHVAGKLAPFLGAVGPVLGLINVFLPSGPSPEIQIMLQEFARINAKFEQVFTKLDRLESKVIEKAIKSQYGKYQSHISALSHLLSNFINVSSNGASNKTKESRKKEFLEAYENSDKSATLKLWQGMMSNRVLMDYIPESVAHYTFNHHLRTQNILKSVLNTILQGVNVKMYHHQMIGGDNDTYIDKKDQWVENIQKLTDEMEEFDKIVADRYLRQAQDDTDKLLGDMFGSPNKEFADALYNILSEKYDWRNWLVVVYNPLEGGEVHWVQHCNGIKRFRQHGRNTVVASIDKLYSAINLDSVTKNLKGVPTGRSSTKGWLWSRYYKYRRYDANMIFDHIPSDIRDYCNYPGLGVIKYSADIHYRAPKDHLVIVNKSIYFAEVNIVSKFMRLDN